MTVMSAVLAASLAVTSTIDTDLVERELSQGVKFAVWPKGKVPGVTTEGAPYRILNTDGGILRIVDVLEPELTFMAAPGDGVKPAMLVFPGGGYNYVTYSSEGTEIAKWLNSLGISAFILKYRCPDQPDLAHMDAQRSMSLIRSRASEFSIDPERIGVIGFSAGGNLSVRLSTNWKNRAYAPIDAVDAVSCRPNLTLPIYPWRLVVGDNAEKTLPTMLRAEFPVASDTPPAFMVQSADDFAHVENSLAYYTALKYAGVNSEMHLYPSGGHGYGLRKKDNPTDGWEDLAAVWLKRQFN